MDYEKAYKEALERARKIHDEIVNNEVIGFPGQITDIFPELAESEDEKIRKKIEQLIRLNTSGAEKTHLLAWLEKQKENPKNAISIPADCASNAKCPYKIHGEGEFIGDIHDSPAYWRGWDDAMKHKESLHIPESCKENPDSFTDGQKEQKPIKWTDLTWKDIVQLEGIINNVNYEFRNGIGQESFGKEVLEKFREYKGDEYLDGTEQKPAECLKAERDGWYVCIKDFYAGGKKQCSVGDLVQAKGGMYMMGKEDISEWFRRAYYEEVRDASWSNTNTNIPEQKPVEWSEEDERILTSIIERGSSQVPFGEPALRGEQMEWLMNRLKSLRPPKDCSDCSKHLQGYIDGRGDAENKLLDMYGILLMPDGELRMKPQWKPSVEQMRALQNAVALTACDKDLARLYNQLKKLM